MSHQHYDKSASTGHTQHARLRRLGHLSRLEPTENGRPGSVGEKGGFGGAEVLQGSCRTAVVTFVCNGATASAVLHVIPNLFWLSPRALTAARSAHGRLFLGWTTGGCVAVSARELNLVWFGMA